MKNILELSTLFTLVSLMIRGSRGWGFFLKSIIISLVLSLLFVSSVDVLCIFNDDCVVLGGDAIIGVQGIEFGVDSTVLWCFCIECKLVLIISSAKT